jgi:hypothetical protein
VSVTAMSAKSLTVLVTLAVFSTGFGSIDVEVTATEVLPSEVVAGQVVGYGVGTGNERTKLTVTEVKSSIVPTLHGNLPSLLTGRQLDPMLESLVPAGSVAFSCTPVALLGPAFVMTTVYVAVLPNVIPAGGVA